MKKSLIIVATLGVSLSLAACGNSSSSSSSNEKAMVKKSATPKYYFKNNVVKIHDLKIKITKTKIIQPGQPGNVYGNKPVFAVWYDTTNLTNKDINPTSAWIAVFTAIQDNDKNSVNELEVASLPDDQYLDTQTETIKKNGTVSNAVAYTLSDTTTPVQLKASKGVDGKVLGTKTYKIVENN
ncbi:DUF5067 domain-containing protein [Limosilactobacillus fermentum]|uniref:DUF5067 domain-containing protein n=1 Tax=Limosilactobacillus fermentum TaxID=1613 RepID=UPI001C0D5CDB|nr:DUF5067 domain-containing protein [Limosilactobacillus fermentum]QWQ33156.1 DUF5067 domain-containing protein [Limosilactobacillus fermentum]